MERWTINCTDRDDGERDFYAHAISMIDDRGFRVASHFILSASSSNEWAIIWQVQLWAGLSKKEISYLLQ